MSNAEQPHAHKVEEQQILENAARAVAVREIAKRIKDFEQAKKEYKQYLEYSLKAYALGLNSKDVRFWRQVISQIDKITFSDIKKPAEQ